MFDVLHNARIARLRLEISNAFGLDISCMKLTAGTTVLSDRDTLADCIDFVGDPPALAVNLNLIVINKESLEVTYKEFLASKNQGEVRVCRDCGSSTVVRNGDWAMIIRRSDRKEDETNTHYDLYYLPTWKQGPVKSTYHHQPTTAKPHGEDMTFSNCGGYLHLEDDYGRKEVKTLSELVPEM